MIAEIHLWIPFLDLIVYAFIGILLGLGFFYWCMGRIYDVLKAWMKRDQHVVDDEPPRGRIVRTPEDPDRNRISM